ncbi:MAG: SH3 domain-containing protein [Paracoccaceae bacterium]
MTRLLAVLALLVLPPLAMAQQLPLHHRVDGVASDDVLNIRAGPSASEPILGALRPFAINVEVLRLSPDGRWGLVAVDGESNGWASMRYLTPTPAAGPVPRPLTCVGTEPFWRLSILPRGSEYQAMGGPLVFLETELEEPTFQGFVARLVERADRGGGPTIRTLTAAREVCGDGMSDRIFGLSAQVDVAGPSGDAVLRGCCTLDHR